MCEGKRNVPNSNIHLQVYDQSPGMPTTGCCSEAESFSRFLIIVVKSDLCWNVDGWRRCSSDPPTLLGYLPIPGVGKSTWCTGFQLERITKSQSPIRVGSPSKEFPVGCQRGIMIVA